MSSRLTSESRIYADKAKDLNRQVSFIRCVKFMRELYSQPTYEKACLSYMAICLLSICNECLLLPQIFGAGSCSVHYTNKLFYRSIRFSKNIYFISSSF